MKTDQKRSIPEILQDTEYITAICREAIRHRLRLHKKLGFPIVVWRDGRVVEIPPGAIEVPDAPEAETDA